MSESLISAASEPEWAAFAAIDWADQKNFWRLVPAGSQRYEQGELENTPEAVEAWAAALQQRFGGRAVAVCLEQSRGPLVYMLTKYPHLVLFPVHPTTAARYRETFCPSGAKDDPSDTASLLDLLIRHRERLRPLQPDTVETRLLHFLVEERRRTVDEKTRQSNRLTDCLKMYFPQILQWFDDVTTPLVGDLLERWPGLEQLQRAHPGTLRRFFHEHNCRSQELLEERIAAISQAIPATRDQAVLEAGMLMSRGLVTLLAALRGNIAAFDKRIAELVRAHPDGALFASLPGAGPVLVPRLIAAFGTRRDRYQNADEMERYSGIAPVKKASGKTELVHFRYACPKFVRQTFHEFASHSIGHSEWARAYYEHLRNDEKKDHHPAVRALAFKWIRIIFRCWKDGKPYDEQVYQKSLRRRGSLLGAAFASATGVGWKTVAGFQKLSENNA
jgi:transposase